MVVTLVKLNLKYAEAIHALSSMPQVRDALGLPVGKVEDTIHFIKRECVDEEAGITVPRVVLDEDGQVIGVTSLMFIDYQKKSCHIGSWLGYEFWGKGYNLEAKIAILEIAFFELGLERVFAGAREVNTRSIKAQEKLPFIRLHVEEVYPQEHAWLETKEKQRCVLNVFEREDFIRYRTSLVEITGERDLYFPYLLLADGNEEMVRQYMNDGILYAIHCGGHLIGVTLLIERTKTSIEIKNIAIEPEYKGKGIGKIVLQMISDSSKAKGYTRVIVGTANSSIDNIVFYQKVGFRMEKIEKDFFIQYEKSILDLL